MIRVMCPAGKSSGFPTCVRVTKRIPSARNRPTRGASHHFLVQLHVGDTVHQQAADPIGPLVDGHIMSDLIQLSGGSQSGGAAADDGHALAGAG